MSVGRAARYVYERLRPRLQRTLGIPRRYVLRHQRGDRHAGGGDDEDDVVIQYNNTTPGLITDGISVVTVDRRRRWLYEVRYRGYLSGRLVVLSRGVRCLGDTLLGDRDDVPWWLLDSETVDEDDLPWWVPDDVTIRPRVACERCGDRVVAEAGSVYTPGRTPGGAGSGDARTFCADCWQRGRE